MKNALHNSKIIPALLISALISVSTTAQSAEAMQTIKVELTPSANIVSLDAYVEPVKAATVSAQTSGRILKLNYDINDVVVNGAPLLEITSVEQGAALATANAERAKAQAINIEAQRQLTRYQTLFPQGAISQGAMDEAEANAKSAEQQLSAANARITQATESVKYTVVTAPFSGIVSQRHVEEGETVSPGQALYSGYSLNQMRAVAHVPQRYIDALKSQPQITLLLPNGEQVESQQLTLFSFVDSNTHSYKVRINLPENLTSVIPGSLVKAQFLATSRPAIFLPESSLLTMNELSAVYILQNNSWVLTQVRTGQSNSGNVEILAGLSSGDVVAKEAYQALQTLDKNN
ncbi:efflux RND transporter periplasmic adaptor subunit [Shewanella pneumatophori]|uniref:Efflux RND transporter periplasmic adaptor subunit n=1 Tax=Shewanella pneumatophori TaxID=314092 RepID=A0A9X1ZCV3_9GAMM|nr:efflux RND transporter periplasmic adaptor subunit [Shewanella pneumatophori]MCL1139211.1 efflux RND transporter periplasmic adaptor subunit [Shewanella pneumatophori]